MLRTCRFAALHRTVPSWAQSSRYLRYMHWSSTRLKQVLSVALRLIQNGDCSVQVTLIQAETGATGPTMLTMPSGSTPVSSLTLAALTGRRFLTPHSIRHSNSLFPALVLKTARPLRSGRSV